ncbi:MAG: hypothetical protein KDK70_28205, partial [Myxococcales bacterium]|nr:hypothetical protein [Myxococcales bacterium]
MLDPDGSSDAYEREERLGHRERRLDDLEACLHDGCTEALRTRWCEELALVHAEHLHDGNAERAAQLQHRLAQQLERTDPTPRRPLLQRQHLAWAQVCLDAMRHRVARGLDPDPRARLPELLTRAEAIASADGGDVLLAEALDLAHEVLRRSDHL